MLFNDCNFDCYVTSKPTSLFRELTEEEKCKAAHFNWNNFREF
jgi:hypothetical protein